jgi:hypothetical protein
VVTWGQLEDAQKPRDLRAVVGTTVPYYPSVFVCVPVWRRDVVPTISRVSLSVALEGITVMIAPIPDRLDRGNREPSDDARNVTRCESGGCIQFMAPRPTLWGSQCPSGSKLSPLSGPSPISIVRLAGCGRHARRNIIGFSEFSVARGRSVRSRRWPFHTTNISLSASWAIVRMCREVWSVRTRGSHSDGHMRCYLVGPGPRP